MCTRDPSTVKDAGFTMHCGDDGPCPTSSDTLAQLVFYVARIFTRFDIVFVGRGRIETDGHSPKCVIVRIIPGRVPISTENGIIETPNAERLAVVYRIQN